MNKNTYKKGIITIGILILFLPFINSVNAEEKTILVTSPKGGQIVRLDSMTTIIWIPPEYYNNNESIGPIGMIPFKSVTILLFQELTQVTSIHMAIHNTGKYLWNVSSEGYRIGDNYRLKIIVMVDYDYYGYSGFFSIKGEPILSPAAQFFVEYGTVITIVIIVVVMGVIYDFKTKKRILRWIRKRKGE